MLKFKNYFWGMPFWEANRRCWVRAYVASKVESTPLGHTILNKLYAHIVLSMSYTVGTVPAEMLILKDNGESVFSGEFHFPDTCTHV